MALCSSSGDTAAEGGGSLLEEARAALDDGTADMSLLVRVLRIAHSEEASCSTAQCPPLSVDTGCSIKTCP